MAISRKIKMKGELEATESRKYDGVHHNAKIRGRPEFLDGIFFVKIGLFFFNIKCLENRKVISQKLY